MPTPPVGPVFQQRPASQEADLGATVTMHCKVAGNPTPEIEWIYENSDQVSYARASLVHGRA